VCVRYAGSPGVLVLHDPLNVFHIIRAIDPPTSPVTPNARQEAFALPAKKGRPGNVETAADFIRFIFFRAFSCNHAALAEWITAISYGKYSYYDTEKNLVVKKKFLVFGGLDGGVEDAW
jgi:hypothetical protein